MQVTVWPSLASRPLLLGRRTGCAESEMRDPGAPAFPLGASGGDCGHPGGPHYLGISPDRDFPQPEQPWPWELRVLKILRLFH